MYPLVQNIASGQLHLKEKKKKKKGNGYIAEVETWNVWQISDTKPKHLYQPIKALGKVFQNKFNLETMCSVFLREKKKKRLTSSMTNVNLIVGLQARQD